MALTKAEARLEALKLAVRPGLELAVIMVTAEAYYQFIANDHALPLEDADADVTIKSKKAKQ